MLGGTDGKEERRMREGMEFEGWMIYKVNGKIVKGSEWEKNQESLIRG